MTNLPSKKLLVITGPTASGKSRLALDLADKIPLEIISADSMQVYKYMDIGTDKPPAEDQAKIKHHLIDIKDPDEAWSVEEFQRRATDAIDAIRGRGRLPCVVGGTGFYIRALLQGFPLEEAPPNREFRREMELVAKTKGNQFLHTMLKAKDFESWRGLHPNDVKRVIRALEYYEATGKPISRRLQSNKPPAYDALILGLLWDRKYLYQRIDQRVDLQFARGLVDEVKHLFDMGYSCMLPSMQGLCYKETCGYLLGLLSYEETKSLMRRNTRRFAKRQFTWFARENGINWIPTGNNETWKSVVEKALQATDYHAIGESGEV